MTTMRKRSKLSAMIALCFFVLTLFPAGAFAASFSDAGSFSEYAEALKAKGITTGYGDGTFKPNEEMSRAHYAVWMVRAKGLALANPATPTFKDVSKKHAYYGEIEAAVKANLIQGYPDGTFKPADKLTRRQLATMIVRALGKAEEAKTTPSAFVDTINITDAEVKGAIAIVKNLGIVDGYADGTFGPNKIATRGQAAKFVANYLNYLEDLKVVSVSAINATQVLVTFNKEVEKTDAETASNYSIGNYTITSAKLQETNKSVLITLNAPITGTNLYIVKPIKSATNAEVKTAIFTKVETYSDTVAPTIAKIEYPVFDKVVVTFSEPMKSLGTVTASIDGSTVALPPVAPFAAGSATVTYDLAALAADKDITVIVVGARDQADNLINPNPVNLTLKKTKTDTVAPSVVDVKALSDTRVEVTFSEKLAANPVVKVGGVAATIPAAYDATKENKVFVATFDSATGVKLVEVSAGYADMSGNTGVAYSKLVQLVADNVAPVLLGTEVKVIANVPYLVFRYNEDVTPVVAGDVNGTRVKDFISYPFTAAANPQVYVNGATTDTKAVMLNIAAYAEGSYTITVPAGFVKDLSNNNSATAPVSFVKGILSIVDTTAPTVNALPAFSADNTSLTVVFSEDMDPATALNVGNYKVGGATIFTSAIFAGDAKTVKLTINPGTITVTGDRLLTVSGAKDKAGNVMTSYSAIVNVKENVKPAVASAKLTNANTIQVTMTENVQAFAAADFEVYVNGVKVTATTAVGADSKVATVTLGGAIDDLNKVIQVKLVNEAMVDLAGNKAITGNLVTVTQ